ncbi:ABC transporter permease [Luteitalea sp.]|uniref:ABC transporter permease n=1 Tax=Luteitalea sp. TaxID=2004800 RepID=UPI0025C51154|nr:ABC transporter permease [Luteitalea sp.]
MRRMVVLFSRVLDVVFRGRRDRRVFEEVQQHLDLLTEEHLRRGLSLAQAELAARKSFGGVDQVIASYRDQRGWPWLTRLTEDTWCAARQISRDMRFSAAVVGVLALGVGVSHLFLTLTYAHTMRGLPIPAVDRVMFVSTATRQGPLQGLSFQEFRDLQALPTFSDLAAFSNTQVTLGGEGDVPDRIDAAYASAGGFEVAGATPVHGRLITAADDRVGSVPVLVLTERVWRDRYGTSPDVLGRTVLVGGQATTVVGVVSDASGFPSPAAVFLPLAHQPGIVDAARDARSLRVFGRLADGVEVTDAAAAVGAASTRWEASYPTSNRGVRAVVVPINERYNGPIQGWLPFMLAGLIVVAVASANVGNLLLTRGAARAREVAIRTALGASRGRIVRQLLMESTLMGALASALGLLVSRVALAAYRAGVPDNILPYWIDYSLDRVVVMILVALAIATVAACALVPAFVVSRADAASVLKDGGRAETGRRSRGWASTAFLAAELALAVVLLTQVGAATVNSLAHDVPTNHLLDDTDVFTGALTLPVNGEASAERRRQFLAHVLERMAALPGVTMVTLSSHLPLGGAFGRRLRIADRPAGAGAEEPQIGALDVAPGYFETLGLPVTRGRSYDVADARSEAATVVINERLASLYFPGVEPVGQRIAVVPEGAATMAPEWRTVVGVVADVRQRPVPEVQPLAYLPMGGAPSATAWLMVRSAANAGRLAAPAREALRQIDPAIPLSNPRTLAAATRDLTWAGRISARLALVVCLATFILATVGLYAVVAHRAAQRRREFGLRVVLGARAPALVALVTGHVRAAMGIGLVVGVAGAVAWDRAFSPVPQKAFRVADPLVLAMALGVLVLVVVLGCALPVRRAIGVSPANLLREE